MGEMRKLLLLILSFSVQSQRKEEIIQRIQAMDEDVQKGIVQCIQEVRQTNRTKRHHKSKMSG